MPQPETALCVVEVNLAGEPRDVAVSEGTLVDEDLTRGDDDGEHVLDGDGIHLFDGFTRFMPTPEEPPVQNVIFGTSGNGRRDGDTITDFDVAEDSLLLTDGASILSVTETRKGNVVICLDRGDRDKIKAENVADASAIDIHFSDDPFAVA